MVEITSEEQNKVKRMKRAQVSENSLRDIWDHFKCTNMAQTVKHLSTMWETWVQSLGQEDPLEKEMVIHSSTLAWKIPWTEDLVRLQSMGSQRVGHD